MSVSWITLTELRAFYNIDRQAYTRLVFQLGLDCHTSKKVVALWHWLETVGFSDFVYHSLTLFPKELLHSLANESASCLNCLDEATILHTDNNHLPVMSDVGGKTLSLEFVFAKKESAKIAINKFVRDICDEVFSDIVPTNSWDNQVQLLAPAVKPQDYIHRQEDNGNDSQSQIMANPQAHYEANQHSRTDRILFVTFSRGYPVTREQLGKFFTRKYGEDCVEDILMGNKYESLYARVIVKSVSYIVRILGDNALMQFNIHGKDVRVRRFIAKRPPVAAVSASVPAPTKLN